jgi:hypothetical protein
MIAEGLELKLDEPRQDSRHGAHQQAIFLPCKAVPIMPLLPVTALNMASQMPWRLL